MGDSLFAYSEEVSDAAMRVLVLFSWFLSVRLLCCHSLGHFESREWMRLLEEIQTKMKRADLENRHVTIYKSSIIIWISVDVQFQM